MTIRALITLGIGPGGSVKFDLTGGLDLGAAVVVVVTQSQKRPGPAPGSYPPKRYYLPPGWKKKTKPSIEEVKELYVEARREIPPKEQGGLLPVRHRVDGGSDKRLVAARLVDFGSLVTDLAALRRLFAALQDIRRSREQLAQNAIDEQTRAEAERAFRAKRKRDEEEFIITILLND